MAVIVYIIVGMMGMATALFLINVARRSGKAKVEIEEDGKGGQDPELNVDTPLKGSVAEEISQLVGSGRDGKEVTGKIQGIFEEELKKRITLNTQELTKEYKNIISEKAKNEEIAWKKYKKVLSDKNETEAVVRSIAEGLVVVNAKGQVIMMNPAAEKLLGVSGKDKIGKPIADNLKEEQLISLVKDSPNEAHKEIELISPHNETKKILRASSAVIENADGQTVGMVSVLSDITKQKELDRMKSNFVASVSHELRTPMVIMQKSLFLIRDEFTGKLSDNQDKFLSIIDRNLKRLTVLINDLLDLSKIESGKLQIKRQPSSLKKIIDDSVEGLNTWAQTKSINIIKKMPDELPEISLDQNRVIQVLNNLIGNAIKFTPNSGTIGIEVILNEEQKEVCVSVKDNGIGISQENLARVFDKFYQIEERSSIDISGTGIGLSVAKELVELHGGRIWVESQKGQGTKFSFTLPLSA